MASKGDRTSKKRIAKGPREQALSVLMPRILGGIETHGQVYVMEFRGGLLPTNFVVAEESGFCILLQGIPSPDADPAFDFAVTWKGAEVMQGSIRPNRRGTVLGGLVRVERWERGDALGAWQLTVFDVFPTDSRLLDSDDVEQSLRSLYKYKRSLLQAAEFDPDGERE